jgi:tetratricopeptide (TPR) repeat protein
LDQSEGLERTVAICEEALRRVAIPSAEHLQVLMSLADTLYALDEDARAAVHYNTILEETPNETGAINGLGWIAHDANDMALAVELFERSVAVRPTAQGLAGRASALRYEDGISKDEYVTQFDAALALSPRYRWAAREKAWGLFDFGDLDAATAAARAALELEPTDVSSLYALGYFLNEQNAYEEAFEHLNLAANDPDAFTAVFSQRSLASFGRGNYRFALGDADRVIKDWPDDSTGYVRRARALEALGESNTAIQELSAFVEATFDAFALYWLADIQYGADDVGGARMSLERIVSANEADYWTHEFLAMIYVETDRPGDARHHAQEALLLKPDASFPVYYEALILVSEKKYEAAEEQVMEAIERGLPEHSARYFLESLMSQGQFGQAIRLRARFFEVGALGR